MGIEQQEEEEGVYLYICRFALEEGVCFQQQAIQLWISSDQNISVFICRSTSSFADHATSLESLSCGTDNAHSWPAHSNVGNRTNLQRKLPSTLKGSQTINAQ